MSLSTKLQAVMAVQSVVTLVVGLTAYYSMKSVTTAYSHVADVNLAKAQDVSDLRYFSSQAARVLARLAMPGNKEADVERLSKKFEVAVKEYGKADELFAKRPFAAGEQEKFAATQAQWARMVASGTKAVKLSADPSPEAKNAAVVLIQTEVKTVGEVQGKSLEDLADFQSAEAKTWVTTATEAQAKGDHLILILSILGFFASGVMAMVLARRLTKALAAIVASLRSGAHEVAAASQQISGASIELSAGAHQQAAAVQETAASMQEIDAMIAKNAQNARETQMLSRSSRDAVTEGKTAVAEVVTSMNEIREVNSRVTDHIKMSNEEFRSVVGLISEIASKTQVINDIVFQTKLLSFNASVESARAGEHGKGFSVVAEEIGNLAKLSGTAAVEINDMVKASVANVEAIVSRTESQTESLINSCNASVETGIAVAANCTRKLEDVVGQVTSMASRLDDIGSASQEQASGSSEIARAMQQLDTITHQSSKVSEESSMASEKLNVQALELRSLVEDLSEVTYGERVAFSSAHVTPMRPRESARSSRAA